MMLISVSEILKMLTSAIILKLIMIRIAMDMMLQINPLQTEYVAVPDSSIGHALFQQQYTLLESICQ